ncbi:Os03g0639350 [Oryza sativa Japonica Group]|uniref:Os03g0639350 protein n=1 Tax=Oryza sativa subsp. japonica TaxID=39947 RepID=A0A0P0W131_ORYSJ|nr:hypothetical protein EE612_019147 [Oryza sativa]BAS85416.1 Os03g0639350 [Oryza sativa Japonica Group]
MSSCRALIFSLILSRLLLSERLCTSAARLLRAVVIFAGGLRASAADSDSASCIASHAPPVSVSPLALAAPVAGARRLRGGGGAEAAVGPPRRRRHGGRLVAVAVVAPAAGDGVRAPHRRGRRAAAPGLARRALLHLHLVAPADARPDRAQHRRRRAAAAAAGLRLPPSRAAGRPPRPDELRQVPGVVAAVRQAHRLLPRAGRVRRLGRRHQLARRLGRRARPATLLLRHCRVALASLSFAVGARARASRRRLRRRRDGRLVEEVREDVLLQRVGEREREPQAGLVFLHRRRRRLLRRPRRQLPVVILALHDDMAVAPEQLNEVCEPECPGCVTHVAPIRDELVHRSSDGSNHG